MGPWEERQVGASGLRIFNTLTRRKEEFTPLEAGQARMYTCGPTVYRYAHIGNLRSYLMADWLRRALEQQGYRVTQVKNITDVGHMRQEALERGEDKVIAAALAEGKTPNQIAQLYTEAFRADEAKLNIQPAHIFPKASEHVAEMVEMVQALLERGFAYSAQGNVYFDVTRFQEYGKLSGNRCEGLEEGARVEVDPAKRDPRDFTLWKAAEPGRMLKWASPWGDGFPGWHIECSAMAIKYLGPHLDLHTGGVDNIFPHHEDEIAQSEAIHDKPFARYWVHGQHLLVDGLKMAKSTGNAYTLADLERRGFDPLAFRYLSLTVGYRQRMNFTWSALRAAQRGLERLREKAATRDGAAGPTPAEVEAWRQRFGAALNDDLGLPRALAVAWQAARRARLDAATRARLLLEFDRVLGLDLSRAIAPPSLPAAVREPVERREAHRQAGRYAEADQLRRQIEESDLEVRDTPGGPQVLFRRPSQAMATAVAAIASSQEVPSLLAEPASVDFSVSILARDNRPEVERCLRSVLAHASGHSLEVVVVDNGSSDDSGPWLDETVAANPAIRVIHADHSLGAAAGRNVAFKQSRGRYLLWLDTSVEIVGDVFTPLKEALADASVGLVGPWGVCSQDLRNFAEASGGEVDAMQGYLIALRRDLLGQVGLLDEKFRFYRHLDLDFSVACRAKGRRIVALADLPLVRHPHGEWLLLAADERERLSKRNFYRFLSRWGHRTDLLLANRR